MKGSYILITIESKYQLHLELPKQVRQRILGNLEIPINSLKCFDLMASTQSAMKKANFDICAKN